MIPLIGAHDFPYIFSDQAASLLSLPLTWAWPSHDSLGVYNLSTLWDWPYSVAFGLAGKIGLNFTLSTLLFGILPAFGLSWLSMGKLLQSYSLSRPARWVGQFLFAANTYLLMLIDGGQLSLAVGYSLLPLAILYLQSRLKFILVMAAISYLDIRYLYVLLVPILLKVLFDLKRLPSYLVTGILTGLVLTGLHSYWLLPAFMAKGPALPATYTRQTQVESLSFASLAHSIFLIHPHWPKNIFGQISPPAPYFFLLPVLAFLPLVVYPKKPAVGFFSALALVSAFLVKGSNPPLPQVYPWLFSHLPGFSLFRDPTKFFPLLAMSYSVLVAFTAQYLYPKFRFWPHLITLYLIFLIIPVLAGGASGLFSLPRNATDYQRLAKFLKSDPDFGRLVWVPVKPPLGYSSPTHPSIDALSLLDKRPFTTGVVGKYDLLNFLREASYSGQLLDIASVKYVGISALDPARDSLKPEDVRYRSVFTDQLSTLPWVATRRDFGSVTLLQTTSAQDIFQVAYSTTFIVGSDAVYQSTSSLAGKPLVFVEEAPGILASISNFPQATVLLNHKSLIDVAAALLPATNFTFPASQLDFSPNSSGWWKRETADLVEWRDFLQQKYNLDNQDFGYGGGWSVAEGQTELSVKLPSCISPCRLLARVMSSNRGGEMAFSQHHNLIGKVKTYLPHQQTNFAWQDVGPLKDGPSLAITTSGDINVLNALAIVPEGLWQQNLRLAQGLLDRRPLPPPASLPQVSYVQHDPTRYTISVTNLSVPATLIFSQNYDSLWRMGNITAVPAYSLLNAFPVSGNGEYTIEYSAQRYARPGLWVSGLTLVVLMGAWISKRQLKPLP